MDEETIDNYLLWEICKQRGIQRIIMKDVTNGEQLKEELIFVLPSSCPDFPVYAVA